MAVRRQVVIAGIAIGMGCLLAVFSHFRQKARWHADEIIGRLPISCAYLGNRLGTFLAGGKQEIGWIVSYEPDYLGPGPIQIHCSVWGNCRSTNPENMVASAGDTEREGRAP